MKKRIVSAVCLSLMCCILSVGTVWGDESDAQTEEEMMSVLFTHDLHSRAEPYKKGGKTTGGFARLKTKLDEEKQRNPEALVLDGGDFSMGTLYQTLYETQAAELTLLGQMGYDVVTLGNHEFDYHTEGLSHMLNAACDKREEQNLAYPQLVSGNIDWNETSEGQQLKEALDRYGSTPYTILERAGTKIGIFGVMGEDANSKIITNEIQFDSIIDTSKEMVKELKEKGAELIICLSHSGTNDEKDRSEDEQLAEEIPEIDVIISGHTHTTLKEVIHSGDTAIVSAGNYGEALGVLDLIPSQNGRWKVKDYRLEPIKKSIEPDPLIEKAINEYGAMIDEQYLKRFGYEAKQVLAENPIKFKAASDIGKELEEEPIGNLIADAYRYAIKEAEGDSYEPIYATVVPAGIIRDTLHKGTIRVTDAYNISSLGMGADGIPGYPLVGFYLKGKDLKAAVEIDASISGIMPEAQLYPSGIKWIYNPNRMFLNKVAEVYLVNTQEYMVENPYEEARERIEDDKLYRVAAGLYSVQMLGAVEELSKGMLEITPRDKTGEPIKNYEEHIIYNENKEELKEWYALAAYLESFEKNENGISEVPEQYAGVEGRKVEENSKNIIQILKNPNKFTVIAGIFILLILLLIILAVRIMIKKYKKRKRR